MIYNAVTGKKLPHKSNGKLKTLNLSRALAENPIPHYRVAHDTNVKLLQDGSHPAARNESISICITKCMQLLMNHCLSEYIKCRPSAESICGRLLVCCGPSTQERIITEEDVMHKVMLLPENASGSLLGWTISGKLLTITPPTWAVCSMGLPDIQVLDNCITLVGKLLVVCSNACKIHVMTMADFSDHYISVYTAPSTPTCIFASNDCQVIVGGLLHGKLAIFKSNYSETLLTNPPIVVKLLDRSYCKKGKINCGIVTKNTIYNNCGRYLIGLDKESLHQLFSTPLSIEGAVLKGMELCDSHLWAWFDNSGEIAICDLEDGKQMNSIDIG